MSYPLLNEGDYLMGATWEEEHELQSGWVFWYNYRLKAKYKQGVPFCDKLHAIGEAQTIEEFFRTYCYLQRPSEQYREIELKFFRKHEVPMWEHSPNGGCWIVQLPKSRSIDEKWERLLFACIGEQFNDLNVIGVVLSLRPTVNIIQLWLKDSKKDGSLLEVSRKLRDVLKLDVTRELLYYKEHNKSIKVWRCGIDRTTRR